MGTRKVTLIGKISSRTVRGLPPGTKQERLNRFAVDSTGTTWPVGTKFVAICGGFDNRINDTYCEAAIVSSPAP